MNLSPKFDNNRVATVNPVTLREDPLDPYCAFFENSFWLTTGFVFNQKWICVQTILLMIFIVLLACEQARSVWEERFFHPFIKQRACSQAYCLSICYLNLFLRVYLRRY